MENVILLYISDKTRFILFYYNAQMEKLHEKSCKCDMIVVYDTRCLKPKWMSDQTYLFVLLYF